MTRLLDLAAEALAVAEGETLVTVTRERSTMLRFARSRPTQATSIEDLTLEIAALCDGHVGRASVNGVGREAIARCARAARQAAEAGARTGGAGSYPGFPVPRPTRAHHGYDPETAEFDPRLGAAALNAAFAVTLDEGVEANGIWTAGEVDTAIVSSTGIEVRDRVTDGFMKVVAIAPDGRSGYASRPAIAAGDLDAVALAERASRKARLTGDEAMLPAGSYPIVMEPQAVQEMLGILAQVAFNGLAHAEGRGALAGRLGTQVVSRAIDLSDSPQDPATLPRSFDAEGTPKEPLPLIQGGVARGVAHDTASAAVAGDGAVSTGHAEVAGGDGQGPGPANLVLAGGDAADEAELCAPIERGVYVSRLWYSNVVAERDATFTAVTRDGTFLIEDGEVSRPLADMRISDSALRILAHVEALGSSAVLSTDAELYGRRFASGTVCPPLRASEIQLARIR